MTRATARGGACLDTRLTGRGLGWASRKTGAFEWVRAGRWAGPTKEGARRPARTHGPTAVGYARVSTTDTRAWNGGGACGVGLLSGCGGRIVTGSAWLLPENPLA